MPTIRCTWVLLLFLWAPLGAMAEDIVRVPEDATTISAAVSAVPDGGTIDVAGGTYFSTGIQGFQLFNLSKSFTLRGRAGETVVLDGSDTRPVLYLMNMDPSEWVVFENLTFRGGVSTSNNQAGGVTVFTAQATFNDCIFEDNFSDTDQSGGGGTTVAVGSVAVFNRCTWQNNSAIGTGGGLRVGGNSTARVHASQFLNNRVNLPGHRPSSTGGAINVRDSSLWVANTRFVGNECGFAGGAIHAAGAWDDNGTLINVANSTFIDNVADPVEGALSTSGGAMHVEDLVTLSVYNSRFITNRADGGGAISGLRAIVDVSDSVFLGNEVTGAGSLAVGGAIALSSNDTAADGANNRRSAELTIMDSLIQGRYETVGVVGKIGGGIHVNGDTSRNYGFSIPQAGTPATNRATVVIDNVVFADLDVEVSGGGTGLGGAMNISLTDLTVRDSLVIDSDATGNFGTAGGIRIAVESTGSIERTTFANNTAEDFGGGLVIDGSDVDVTDCDFFDNEVSPGVSEAVGASFGAAIFSGPNENAFGDPDLDFDVTGTVSGSTFSSNVGLAVYENDRVEAPGNPENLVQYVDNEFFETTFSSDVFRNAFTAEKDVSELNPLILHGINKSPAMDNLELGSEPALGALIAVPPEILDTVAAGDPEATTASYLGFAWSGAGSADLDSVTITDMTGVATTAVGSHALEVGASTFPAEVLQGATPTATFTATPAFITGGGSSSLAWSTTAGTFLGSSLDQNVAGGAASGSQEVQPVATTTYGLCVFTEEGGVVKEATVFVDEGDGLIFADGFESGDTSGWN